MSHNKVEQSTSGGSTIDSIIKIVNKLHSDIQLQDNDEGVKGEHTQENVLPTSKSIGGEEETSERQKNSGGTELERSQSAPQNSTDLVNPIRKLQNALRRLKRKVRYMKTLQLDVDKQLDFLVYEVYELSVRGSASKDLTEDITKQVSNLIRKIPLSSEKQKHKKASPDDQDGDKSHRPIVCLPGIHANEEDLKRLAVFRDVEAKFEGLDDLKKICLLTFAVFPENQEVNRKMLMYWWIGEGILFTRPKTGSVLADVDKPENVVKEILKEFTEKKLIEPVENKRKVEPSCYKMTPFVHSSVVLISMEMKLFDIYQKGEKPTMKISKLNKVCLVEGSSSQPEAKANNMKNAHLIETVFNVSERFPEFICKCFTRMKCLKVLYLGRWERTDSKIEMCKWERTDQEIEMDSRRVMKDLSSLTRLRFLSFQGMSTIKSLSRSACDLNKLIILDLSYCYNLEQLPDDINKLKSLVYLDLTGCEALESVPARLARLYNLQVLKGFVLSDVDTANTCKLNALKRLRNLRKLSVIVHREGFTLDKLIDDIKDFNLLEKLKVWWGSKISLEKKQPYKYETEELENNKRSSKLELPTHLKKLDLQRFPDRELPECLWPENLINLERLRLGSSKRLKGFSALPREPTKCSVKVLCLTSLIKLKVEWRELKNLYFPNLRLLESYECPRVTFCPFDRNGIWRSLE